jgi:predicted amidohydrolase YtcJ
MSKTILTAFLAFSLAASSPIQGTILTEVRDEGRSRPDLILYQGKIFTADWPRRWSEALAVRAERITAIGSSQDVLALAGPTTRKINLGGRTVIPGINDAHLHQGSNPATAVFLEFKGRPNDANGWEALSWVVVVSALAEAVHRAPKGGTISGVIGANILDEPSATRFELDKVAPDHRVILYTWTGHDAILNTTATRALGLAEDEPDILGGFIYRLPGKQTITGRLGEQALWRVLRRIEEGIPLERTVSDLRAFAAEAAQFGITSIQVMSALTPEHYLVRLKAADLPIRVRQMRFLITDANGRKWREGADLPVHPTPRVTISGSKWVLDGTPIERRALQRTPYCDRPGWSGRMNFPEGEIRNILREIVPGRDQLLLHVVGDKTTEIVLKLMEETDAEAHWKGRRVRFEHGDGLSPDLIPRAAKLGIIVVQNPIHNDLRKLSINRLGEERLKQLAPMRSLLQAGIPLAFGSDGPMNPYLGVMFATIHPVNPAEALTREEAVEAYTRGSAYAELAEADKGILAPGKLADLAVLSQDIFTVPVGDLPKTRSVLTLVGGRIIYDGKVLDSDAKAGAVKGARDPADAIPPIAGRRLKIANRRQGNRLQRSGPYRYPNSHKPPRDTRMERFCLP